MRRLIKHIISTSFIAFVAVVSYANPNTTINKTPKDPFSQTFIKIYKDAFSSFIKVKGKEIRHVNLSYFQCKKILPGSISGYISGDAKPVCVFDFGNFESKEDADDEMRRLTQKVTFALAQNALVKYPEIAGDKYLLKRTQIAEIVYGGFYAFNILIDVVKRGNENEEKYGVELSINGGVGTLYKLIWKNEPSRSPYFNKSFKTIFAQFEEAENYKCTEQLPGFTCNAYDSLGKSQLMMEKIVQDFPDARLEFENLTTSIRSLIGEKFVYYLPETNHSIVLRNVVFVLADEYDIVERKSIATYLLKLDENKYSVRLIMYHP